MPGRLCVMVCQNFLGEAAAAVAAEGWPDVDCVAYPSRCGRPGLTWPELQALLPADCTQVVLLGRACLASLGRAGDAPPGFPPLRRVPLEQCFHLVAGARQVGESIDGGAYLMTPSWLADWPARLADLGFAPEQAAGFFGDFARELVLLDTGIDAEAASRLQAMAQALALPARRVPVGLDTTRLLLAREVLQWRLGCEQVAGRQQAARHTRERADHVAAIDMLGRLAPLQHESDVIAAIDDLLQMLFAPRCVHYLRVENGTDLPEPSLPTDVQEALCGLSQPHAMTADGEGFLLRIGRDNAVVGKVAVLGLAFPAQRERYVNLALAMTGFCGVVIENARIRRRLLDAERMASMSILVAGVAHEINTPLGVDLMTVSALQDQTRQIAARFAEHRMTQTDLCGYFERTDAEVSLIRSNLERIGALVETFRQAATGGPRPAATPVHLRRCIDDVVRSLGDRVRQAGVALHIEADPDLTLESWADDWASVFTNLITNSLRHAFGDLGPGTIRIRLEADDRRLRVHYRDDGRGMAPEVLAKVFDPFFTTDLQRNMGLGMHLVYNLVTQRFGGSIRCESRPGQGVSFHIEVPR